MKHLLNETQTLAGRRSFLTQGMAVAGTATIGTALLSTRARAFAEQENEALTKGDAAILRFLAAAEIIESDLWIQYNELGGVQTKEVPGGGGNELYAAALQLLDGDMSQYVHDNTDDELTHAAFLNAYLASRGAETVTLEKFRTLPGSTAKGSSGKRRLTNLMNLNVDTSFWARYRIDTNNPDLDPTSTFPQAVDIRNRTAIPRSDADTKGSSIKPNGDLVATDHLKAIAFTAGFHFAFIEQGGTSLYPGLAQRVTSPEVLRVLLSIGPTEAMHFQTWQDKAGNATPVSDTDFMTGSAVSFRDLKTGQPESLQANLIMPEPCPFLSRKFPACSIIRPTETQGAAMGAVRALTDDGLFIGQSQEFFSLLHDLAQEADGSGRDH